VLPIQAQAFDALGSFDAIDETEVEAESSSPPNNGAAIRSASTCRFTFNSSCSFARNSSITSLMKFALRGLLSYTDFF
jgi:hypothetical protein